MDYRVLKEFWYPTVPAAIKQVKAGENVPIKQRGLQRALVGDVLTLSKDIVTSLAGKSDGPYVEEVLNGEA